MVLEGLSQPLKHSSLTMCSMPRPVHTVLTNKGFPRKPPKEAESCTFKEETVKSQKDRARRMLRVTAPTPEAGSAPQARGRIHRTLKNHPKNWYGRLYDTLRSLSFPSPLARG